MKNEGVLVLLVSVLTFPLLSVTSLDSQGTVKYETQTGKKCVFCHTPVPEPGDLDPKLNAQGKKLKENGCQLPEEQKKKPWITGWP